jgi:hypothetical protein
MNAWRLFRLIAGIISVLSKYWLSLVSLEEQFIFPFLFMGGYLLFIEVFIFLVWWKKKKTIEEFFSRYKFWKSEGDAEKVFPNARISVRTTLIQVLIAVSGFILAFTATKTSPLVYHKLIISSILISIIFGLVYLFIFGGGMIREEITNKTHTIVIEGFHESWMEACLNIQVVSLIFGISLLMY